MLPAIKGGRTRREKSGKWVCDFGLESSHISIIRRIVEHQQQFSLPCLRTLWISLPNCLDFHETLNVYFECCTFQIVKFLIMKTLSFFLKKIIFRAIERSGFLFLIWISIPFTVLILIKINIIWILNLSFSHPNSLQQNWSNVSFLFWPFLFIAFILHANKYEEDIGTEIAKHLDGKSLVMLGTTNKWFHCLIMEDSMWKFACLRDLQLLEPWHTFLNRIKLYAYAFGNEQGVKFSPYSVMLWFL